MIDGWSMIYPGKAIMKINYPAGFSGWAFLIIRLIIGGIFIYASIDKIIAPGEFAKIIHNYRLVHPNLINTMAIIFPWFELIAGIGLITGFRYKGSNFIILCMLLIFIIALGINFVRGVNISCGCFSSSSSANSNLLMRIIEDALMILGCLAIMLKPRLTKRSSQPV